ncbi:hypothetical protein M422DRAFT_67460, partial [Sphaerobolus stellatus SS14]
MNSFVSRYTSNAELTSLETDGLESEVSSNSWGSAAGFGNLDARGLQHFDVPSVQEPTEFLKLHTYDHADPSCKIKIKHGTTTLAFRFQGGIIVAVDSRGSMGSFIASGTVKKVIEINKHLLGTMAGGAADCQYWETYLGMHCRLHELRNGERISVAAASKYLSNLVYSYKGMGLSMGTMICGWDKTTEPGSRAMFSRLDLVAPSPMACWIKAIAGISPMKRRSIYAAGHRDAYSGNSCNLYQVKEDGWEFIGNYDLSKLHFEGPGGEMSKGYGYEERIKKSNRSV